MTPRKPKIWRRQFLVQKEMQYRYVGMLVVPVMSVKALPVHLNILVPDAI